MAKYIDATQKIPLAEATKIVVTIVGAILAYFLIDGIQARNNTAITRIEIIKTITDLQPQVTTQLETKRTSNPHVASAVLAVEFHSKFPTYFFPPRMNLLNKWSDEPLNDLYVYFGLPTTGIEGVYQPGQKLVLSFPIVVKDPAMLDTSNLQLSFDLDTAEFMQKIYSSPMDTISETDQGSISQTNSDKGFLAKLCSCFGQPPKQAQCTPPFIVNKTGVDNANASHIRDEIELISYARIWLQSGFGKNSENAAYDDLIKMPKFSWANPPAPAVTDRGQNQGQTFPAPHQ